MSRKWIKTFMRIVILMCVFFTAGCSEEDFLSNGTLIDRGFDDGFAVVCDGFSLTYGYKDEVYLAAYNEGWNAGRADPECRKWRKANDVD